MPATSTPARSPRPLSLRSGGQRRRIARVVLIGPAHYVPFRGIAVPTVDAFETPLGRVPLDRDALAAIAALPRVHAADAPHAPEHALEVELPFLQVLLPRFTAVPLLVGEARPEEVAPFWTGCGAARRR